MKPSEIRSKSADELVSLEGSLAKELFNLRFQLATASQDVAVSRLGVIKKDIARVKTIIRERELEKKD